MKIYLRKRSCFTFRGRESYELDVLGKTVLMLMRENLCAEICDDPPEGDKIVLDSVYPLLTRKKLEEVIKNTDGSFSFAGGFVERGGASKKVTTVDWLGLFSLSDYPEIINRANEVRRKELAACGVLLEAGAEVDFTSVLEEGVIVERGARVRGKSVVKRDAVVGSGSEIVDSEVGAYTQVKSSCVLQSRIGKNCTVGPFAYLRPNSVVGDGCRIGDFVELKNAKIGAGSKASHLAYIGDAEVGEHVNIGCGVVFVNYNGKTKSKTRVGDGAVIGSNCNLIAPVSVGDGAFLAAGTTLTRSLVDGDFCVGRSRETVKAGRAAEYLK